MRRIVPFLSILAVLACGACETMRFEETEELENRIEGEQPRTAPTIKNTRPYGGIFGKGYVE